MSYLGSKEWYFEVAAGNVAKHSIIHKFGRNEATGTSFVPVSYGAVYNTPQAASATTLRIKSGGNANDTSAGSGAREVTIEGLNETGALVTEALATAGASASSATSATFMRLIDARVTASGIYATSSAGSHAASIVIENGAGGTDWATIDATDFALGHTLIGVYSVPLGNTAYLLEIDIIVDSAKTADLVLFERANILESSAPFSVMLISEEFNGVKGEFSEIFPSPIRYPALTDFGFMAKAAAGTPQISADLEFILVAD